MSLRALMRTTAARLSALYLLLFAACALVLVFYMTSLSVRMLTTQTQQTITEEAQGLANAYQRGGLPQLVRVIELRTRQPSANLYLITDPLGRILAGNVEAIQPGVIDRLGWTDRPFRYRRYGEREAGPDEAGPGGPLPHEAVALVARLSNQMLILVGRDLGEPERFRVIMRRALFVTLAMMGVGALLIWFFVGRTALKRIGSISAAGGRIMQGDLAGRLPVTGSGDEFDRLSENLNAMLERIAVLNEGLKQVSDNIAHDLKTPLTRLRNRAEAALASSGPEDQRAALEATIAESDQLIRTFNAILMISRLEAGQSAEALVAVDVGAVIGDVVELYEPLAEDAGVKLDGQAPAGLTVQGNRELLAQALSNIVDNAIKYSRDGQNEPVVSVMARLEGERVLLEVADNGPGIAEADRERVTDRFVRLEKSRSQPGSGLGLSLAKAVATFHGGRLELAPRDPGLTVRMILPVRGERGA